jgi:hypothetical protein
VVGPILAVETSRKSISILKRADRWSGFGRQPGFDQPFLIGPKTEPNQEIAQIAVGTVHLECHVLEPQRTGVLQPAAQHSGNLIVSGPGHGDRDQRHLTAPVNEDDRRLRIALLVEPEELRDLVGRAGIAPPPLQVGALVQTCGRMGASDSLEEIGDGRQVVESDPRLL